ncbi:hypothetical protein ACWCQL_10135 [Streptomyces sp. NPDC002073]
MASAAGEASPVFVDASGRRPRTVRRIGRLLVVPAAAYLVVLVSTLLGGPTLDVPFLPLPPPLKALKAAEPAADPTDRPSSPDPGLVPRPDQVRPAEGPDVSARPGISGSATASPQGTGTATATTTATPSATVSGSTSPTPSPTGTATATATATATPTAEPSPSPTRRHGRPATPPGQARKPTPKH